VGDGAAGPCPPGTSPNAPGWWGGAGGSGAGSSGGREAGPPTPPRRASWRRHSGPAQPATTPGSAVSRGLSGVLEDGEGVATAAAAVDMSARRRCSAQEARRGPGRAGSGSSSARGSSGSASTASTSGSESEGGSSYADDDQACGVLEGEEPAAQQQLGPGWRPGSQGAEAGGSGGAAPPGELRDYSLLPDPVWLAVLGGLTTRDLCFAARASRGLRGLAVGTSGLWAALYKVGV
jgi:hypothetical protein